MLMQARVIGILLIGVLCGRGQEVRVAGGGGIEPPFNLKWGDPSAGLVDWAARFKLDVVVKAPGDRQRIKILVVSSRQGSLPGHESTSLEAHFVDGRLFEVSVHYTYPGESVEHVRGRHEALKGLLAKRYGSFRFNGRKNATQDGVTTLSEAWHVEARPGNVLLLALTEVRDVKRGDAEARFSLLYRNDAILHGP